MDNSLDNNEQLYSLQIWLAKYWKLIVLLIVLFLIIFGGYSFYQYKQKEDKMSQLTTYYSQFLTIDDKNIEKATQFIESENSLYSISAALNVAKYYVNNQQYNDALSTLIKIKPNVKNDTVLSMLDLRIARLQLQLKEYEAALKTLNEVTSAQFIPMANSLKGDIYLETKQYELARQAYEQAQTQILLNTPQKMLVEPLEIKLNQVNRLLVEQKAESNSTGV